LNASNDRAALRRVGANQWRTRANSSPATPSGGSPRNVSAGTFRARARSGAFYAALNFECIERSCCVAARWQAWPFRTAPIESEQLAGDAFRRVAQERLRGHVQGAREPLQRSVVMAIEDSQGRRRVLSAARQEAERSGYKECA
jgi:hypothetical protein